MRAVLKPNIQNCEEENVWPIKVAEIFTFISRDNMIFHNRMTLNKICNSCAIVKSK